MVKDPLANAGDVRDAGSTPGSGRSSGGGNGIPLQDSCLENAMGRAASWAMAHGLQRVGRDWSYLAHTHEKGLHFYLLYQVILYNFHMNKVGWMCSFYLFYRELPQRIFTSRINSDLYSLISSNVRHSLLFSTVFPTCPWILFSPLSWFTCLLCRTQ